jgi:flagellar biosynthesis/type III secretory pathway M-ring protein FliF/YscJ
MDTTLSVMVLAAIALALGAAWLWGREGMRRQSVLMFILALVIAANVAILVWPDAEGNAPALSQPK